MPEPLPIAQLRDRLLQDVAAANALVLSAPTGSGKSTQVPQYLLDSGLVSGQILVLQPRRLAARMLAQRVASERACELGCEVGFQTRFESLVSDQTRIRFITEGILPRLLLSDRRLPGVGAVILDEFHERSLTCDLSLGLLRHLQQSERPDLRLLIMSATLEVEPLRRYLPAARCLAADTRPFPIDIRYLPTTGRRLPPWDLAAQALQGLVHSGAAGDVLVFMPGVYEIRRTIEACAHANCDERLMVLPLYGDLPPEQQQRAMQAAACRRVVVATNIAETSLTIPGVRHVIDSGLARVSRFDPARGFNALPIEPISRNAADQRAGRAGRQGPGICVRLWTPLEQSHRPLADPPEVRRVDLAEAALQLRQLGFADASSFPWFEAPTPGAIDAAVELLVDLGALRPPPDLRVTPLGQRLASLPAHPRLARLLVAAAEHGCLRQATLVAAILTERTVLVAPADSRRSNSRDTMDVIMPQADEAADATAAGPPAAPGSLPAPSVPAPPVSDFFRIMHALDRARAAGFAPEACTRLGINAAAARQVLRTQAVFVQACRKNHWSMAPGRGAIPEALLKCLLLSYPDRLARRLDQGTLVCALRHGRKAEVERRGATRHEPLLVAADIHEIAPKGGTPRTLLALCSEVRQEWLRELFPDAWQVSEEWAWNDRAAQVEIRRRVVCLGLVLEEKLSTDVDPQRAGEILATHVRSKKLRLEGWTDDVDAWIERVRWVADSFPERSLPRYGEADVAEVVRQLCAGESRFERVRRKPCLGLVRARLVPADQGFVERMAPAQVELPNGRRMRLRYRPGQPPRGNATIQDLYGMQQTPRVAGGRQSVLIEILAPNMRPVQITDDLAGFWTNHYPAVKRDLCRKYPKHEWR